jgi:methyl-accepting chemotaxis protein
MKTVLPWIVVVALLGGGWFLYSGNQKQVADLTAQLQKSTDDATQARQQMADLEKKSASNDELNRLRKDNDDLLRLRNEVHQLRDLTNQLSKAIQTLESKATQTQQRTEQQLAQAQSQAQAARAEAAQAALQAQAQAQSQAQAQGQMSQQANVCINQLRRIESAKRQWASDRGQPATAVPTADDLAAYFGGAFPACPAGGQYSINAVGMAPTCSIPGHVMPGGR